jgi:parallel beta-helix repeat protein
MKRLLVLALLVLAACVPVASLAAPVAVFSADLKTVSVNYAGYSYTIPRPVTPATTFVPTNGHAPIYVASGGNIQSVVNAATPGDVVYIRAGTYNVAGGLQIYNSGAPGKNIVISAAPGDIGKVILRLPDAGLAPDIDIIGVHSSNYITINGLVLEGARDRLALQAWGGVRGGGILWQNGAGTGNVATNNVVYGVVGTCIKEAGHGGEGILIEGNVVFDCGSESRDHGIYMPSNNETIRGNIAFLSAGYGIHLYSNPSNLLVEKNVVFDNLTGGILLAADHTKVYNNTVYRNYDAAHDCQNHQDMSSVFYYSETAQNDDVQRNIFMNACYANARFDTGPQCVGVNGANTCLDDYNDYFNAANVGQSLQAQRGVGDPPFFIRGAHEISTDPLFVNPSIGDFRLKANSPASGMGAYAGVVSITPTIVPTAVPTNTATRTQTATPTRTQTSTATATRTNTPTLTNTPTVPPTAINTPIPTATNTPTSTPTPTPTNTPTRTPECHSITFSDGETITVCK